MPASVTVRVPATAANLGPGFDCLGLALELHNTVSLAPARRTTISVDGAGAESLPQSRDNLVFRAVAAVYDRVGKPVPPLRLHCQNNIPLGRGLGSSAAAAVGGLAAANHLLGQPISPEELLALAAQLEGHPDNAAPALLGGCQVVVKDGEAFRTVSVPLPAKLKAILFIPDFEMPTAQARGLLPSQVSRGDAVYNIGRAALLAAALATGKLELLRTATQDRLHQEARQALFPAMPVLFRAALEAGALGACLSGAGPTVLALSTQKGQAIARALAGAAQRAGLAGRTLEVAPSSRGVHLASAEEDKAR